MNCICGCGTRVSRRATDANLLASRVALDLLAWDKERAAGKLGVEAPELEGLIDRGSNSYRRLIATVHGEREPVSLAEAEAWLDESLERRINREEVTDKGGIFSRDKLRLTAADYERIDRGRPELSFSGRLDEAPAGSGGRDLAGQLERLGQLRAQGLLTAEEFTAAKTQILGHC